MWVVLWCCSAVRDTPRTTTARAPWLKFQTARVRRGAFVLAVRTRGEVRSTRSHVLQAPQVPNLRIVTLVASGKAVSKGDVVVEFDCRQPGAEPAGTPDDGATRSNSAVMTTKASHKMTDEADALSLMTSEYSLERAKLEASKAEILSAIEGEKNRITVGISEGSLDLVKARINTHKVSQQSDLQRLQTQQGQGRTATWTRTKGYLEPDGRSGLLPTG